MTKKMFTAIRFECKGDQSLEDCCNSLSAGVFSSRKEAEDWACVNIKGDIADLGIELDDDEFERFKERQRKFDEGHDNDPALGCPAPVEVLLLPIDGFDIGAVETARDTNYYYRIQETVITGPDAAN